MKRILFIFIIVIIHMQLFSQFTQNNMCTMVEFCETPYAEINQNGVGSFGFNTLNSTFNPVYNDSFEKMLLYIGTNGDVSSKRSGSYSYFYNFEDPIEVDDHNETTFSNMPDMAFSYNIGKYQWQLSHSCTKKLNSVSLKSDYDSYDKTIQLNNMWQLSVSRWLGMNSSIAIAALTNSYSYTKKYYNYYGFREESKVSSNMFDQLQYLLSFNHTHSQKLKSYAVLKTQSSRVKLDPDIEGYDEIGSFVSYPGLFCLGVQYKIYKNAGISLESINEYMYADEKVTYYDCLNDTDITFDFKHSIWNPKLAMGVKVDISKQISLGFIYTRYLKYDNEVHSLYNHHPYRSEYTTSNPVSYNLTAQISLEHFDFVFNYQISQSDLEFINTEDEFLLIESGSFQNESRFLSLKVYYKK